MATPIFVCGAECGIVGVGASGLVSHWSAITGGATISLSTTVINPAGKGLRSIRFNPASSAAPKLTHTYTTALVSPATSVFRFYIRFASFPSADTGLLVNSQGGLMFDQSDTKLKMYGTNLTTTKSPTGVSVVLNRWYCVDMKLVRDTPNNTFDWYVDGVAQPQHTVAAAAGGSASFSVGVQDTVNADVYYDDIIVSATAADFPIGIGGVIGLYPNADVPASHIYNAANDFGKGAGGATNLALPSTAESTAWQSLQNPLSLTIPSNFISARNNVTGEALRFALDDAPANVIGFNGWMLVATTHSISTQASNFALTLYSSGDAGSFGISGDASQLTIVNPCRPYGLDPHDDPLTIARVNAMTAAFNPVAFVNDVYLDGFCLELDCVSYDTVISPVVLTLTPTALTVPSGLTTSISPAIFTLTPTPLTRSTDTVTKSISPAVFTLTATSLTYFVGGITGSISPVTLTLTAIAITGAAAIPGSRSISPVTLTLVAIALNGSAGGIPISRFPKVIEIVQG